MRRLIWLNIVAMSLWLAKAKGVDKAPGYETFRLMQTRNIFDPNRRPMPASATSSARNTASSRTNNSSSLSLTGTMVTNEKALAFFTGTRADYSRVLGVGATIANCKITAISPAEVTFDRAGKTVVLGVGKSLQIEGAPSDVFTPRVVTGTPPPATSEGPTTPMAPPPAAGALPDTPTEDPGENSDPNAESPAPTPPPPPTDTKSEVLRRMMERRAKEMSK